MYIGFLVDKWIQTHYRIRLWWFLWCSVAQFCLTNPSDHSYSTKKGKESCSSVLNHLFSFTKHTETQKKKERKEREGEWVPQEFYSYPLMLHPYYLLSSTSHNQRLKPLFCSRFLLYNTRGWSVHIRAVLCILIISDLGLSLWETMLQLIGKKKKEFSCVTFSCQEVKRFSCGALLLLSGFIIFLLSTAHILLQCRAWSLIHTNICGLTQSQALKFLCKWGRKS